MVKSFIDPKVLSTLGTALALILLDLLLGIILSINKGNFNVRKLPQYLTKNILPYLGSLLMLALFAGSIPIIAAIFYTSTATVVAKFLVDIKDKLAQLIKGLNLE